MPSKITRKNVSPIITRRMAKARTNRSSNRNKENVTEVPAVTTENTRQERLIKPLQEKKNNGARKGEKAAASKPVKIVETKPEKSSATRRHITERKIFKKSTDNSEEIVDNVSSARIEQSTIEEVKSQTANLTSPKNKSRVTRKNTALENSRPKTPEMLISSNVTLRKKMATKNKLQNQMPSKRGDSPRSPPHNISSNVKLTNRMAASSEPKKKMQSKQGDNPKSKDFSKSANDADTKNIDLINSEIHNVELDKAKSSTTILKKKKPVVSLVKTRRMAILEQTEHKTTLELPKATRSGQTQSKRKPVISSQKRRSNSVDHDVDSKLKTIDPNQREIAAILSPTKNRKKPDPDIQLHVRTTSKIQEVDASAEPVYKKKLGNNEAATTSVFDFETNSQDVSTNSDEPLKDVIQKLVRENKAIVKHKRKKGVTKAKDRVTQTKSKLKDPLSRLIEIKNFTTKFGPEATRTSSRNIKQPAVPPKILPISTKMISETNPNELRSVDLINEVTEGIEKPSKDNQNEKIAVPDSFDCVKQLSKPSKIVPDLTKVFSGTTSNDSINESEGMESSSKDNEIGEIAVPDCETPHIWYKPSTPSRVLPITYGASKKALLKSTPQPSHQSTPVRQIGTNIASPWRVPDSSSSIDFDFSKINNHDEGKDDLKEKKGNPISSDRTNNQNQRQPLNTKQTLDDLKKTEKVISNDIENCFGFTVDDESDNDGNITETTPIRKCLPPTGESLPHINTSIISTKSTLKDRRVRKINNQAKSNELIIQPINTTRDGKKQVRNNSPMRKRLQPTRESLPNIINTSIISTKSTSKDQPLRKINNKVKGNVKLIQPTLTSFKKPESVTVKQVGNIHGAVNELATQPIISNDKKNPVNNYTDSSNQRFERLTALHNFFTSNKFQKPCSSTDPISDDENDGPALFDTNWLQQENKKHRSYTRVPKRSYDYESIMTDDESEAGDIPTQRRTKKTKTKVDHGFEEELKKFEEQFNSDCREAESYKLVMEVSKDSTFI